MKCHKCGNGYLIEYCENCDVLPMQWISVKDRLPEEPLSGIYSDTVLACDVEDGYPFLAVYVPKYNSWHEHDEAPEGKISVITHWMPLPNPPQE